MGPAGSDSISGATIPEARILLTDGNPGLFDKFQGPRERKPEESGNRALFQGIHVPPSLPGYHDFP
jgi:hypothetical protein